MANIKSAIKRARQDEVKRERNLSRRSSLKTAVKKVLVALEAGDTEKAQTLLREAEAKLARAAGKGTIHKNTAQRKTSRLAKKVAASVKQKVAA